MVRPAIVTLGLCGAMFVASSTALAQVGGAKQPSVGGKAAAIETFRSLNPGSGLLMEGNRITRVHGASFAHGNSPQASAASFIKNDLGMFGISAADLVAQGPWEDGHAVQPIMYDAASGTYKFTGLYYQQVRDGIPVFRSRAMMLIRNEMTFPMVLVSADLRDIGDFHPAMQMNEEAARAVVGKIVGPDSAISGPQTVIFAGVDDAVVAPRLALQFITEGGNAAVGAYQKTLFVIDAANSNVLHQESLVEDVNITGNVSGQVTSGYGADICAPAVLAPLPYAAVTLGPNIVFADVNGNYVMPNAGSGSVSLSSTVAGQYFEVFNPGPSPATTLSQSVTPPGPLNFVHNADNTSEFVRAEVNAYLQANIVRDYLLGIVPNYPTISSQTGFPVNVNINQNCNAFYNGNSINFYIAGSGCTNTANSTVVYHEYGHHVVQTGGSGQGAYGEGMADCVAIMVSDLSCLGDGFHTCGECLRDANNPCQYQTPGCSTCGSESHACGQLISGCVWSTRNNLQATNPGTYRNIISSLTFNSVMVHTGSSITPSITVDFLTLDDDDDDIANGTPHYSEINNGFTAHNMAGPALAPLTITYPNGKPTFVNPTGGTTLRVNVGPLTGSPQPGTGKFFYDIGSGFVQGTMNVVSPNVYDAVFPASSCGTVIKYYVSAQTTTAVTVNSPSSAPSTFFAATSAVGVGPTVFADTFEGNLGWTVANSGGITAGMWDKGVPVADCDRGNPQADFDGSGQCYLTQNTGGPPNDPCNTDVDGGTTTLTSPVMDASQGAPILSYARWYSNTEGASPEADTFVVEFSTNNGSSWLPLETVGPTSTSLNPEVSGGWFVKSFSLKSVPGFVSTNQFRVRFNASDLGSGSVIEAAIDAVKLQTLLCTNPCIGDINGTGVVNIDDLLAVINAWGPCAGCPADVTGNGVVNIDDLLAVINTWGTCP